MGGYIVRRLLSLIPVLFVVAIVVFSIIHVTPGDPAAILLGEEASKADIDELRSKLGLDRPIYEQFGIWLLGLLSGNLGESIFLDKPVTEAFFERLAPTLSLAIIAQVIGVFLALFLGITAVKRRGTIVDQSVMGFSMLGISIPSFLLGSLLVMFFSVKLRWLPVAGYQPLSEGLWQHIKYLLLPGIVLGIIQAALITRMTRSSILDVMSGNFIKTAKAKGVREKTIVYTHALRVAFIPILTVIGESFGGLVTGAAVIETLFNIPGVGQLIVNSISRRDYSVIQGSVLLVTVAYVFVNLIVDLLYGLVDPRVRLSKK
ncbi:MULTISPECIES: ABC transporter permease [Paenibacillus]|uniref:ABC transporter permease n=1 Tax=Paenibacillus TaxID=44249 RepID=UPI0009A5BFDF|nr:MULTISPECIES: ABC transporter permease [Paenibacillus]MCZ1268947.1 ABC transporter permease [Paenibacillus tundrae]WDQ30544.1 ABC transporter permease [Paenibacillus marchantiae]SLJ95223.1 peptide/nickel transport system permease protein [Paenibacillus sp. RU5A]SOC67378.1 peptide/nickel transport system permease protein [Paenibacillus sp. RU26A]SOC69184.1 peptide/nickel transport system permease protein [Paenibacillus sp. RU5M]